MFNRKRIRLFLLMISALIFTVMYASFASAAVNLQAPIDAAEVNVDNDTLVFEFNYTDLGGTVECNLTLDDSVVGTNASVTLDTNTQIYSDTAFSQGTSYWNVTCGNTTNISTSVTRSIIFDYANPVVTPDANEDNIYPAGQFAAKDGDVVFLNVTVTDAPAGVASVIVDASDLGCSATLSLVKDGATDNYNNTCTLSSATEGFRTLVVNATDQASNFNDSMFITVAVDNTNPAVFAPDVNETVVTSSTSITVEINVTDNDEVDNETVFVGVAGTQVQMYNVTDELYRVITTAGALGCSEGACTLWFNASDGAWNLNETTNYSIAVDDTGPVVTPNAVIYPAGQSAARNGDTIIFNATVTDAPAGVTSVIADADFDLGCGAVTLVKDGATDYYNNTCTLNIPSHGTRGITVNATDDLGNYNDTEIIIVLVDIYNPEVFDPFVSESFAHSNQSITVEINVTDFTLDYSSIEVNGVSMAFVSDDLFRVVTNGTDLGCTSNGACTLTFNASDNASNYNDTTTTSFTIDNSNPAVFAPDVNESLVTSSTSITVEINVTDVGAAGVDNESVFVGTGGTWVQMYNVTDELFRVITTPSALGCAADSVCTLTFNATDFADNYNDTTVSPSFDVDDSGPAVTPNEVGYPGDQFAAKDGDVVFLNVTVTDAPAGVASVIVDASDLGCSATLSLVKDGATDNYNNTCTLSSATEGTRSLTINATDQASNFNDSMFITVAVDNTNPAVFAPDVNETVVTSSTSITVEINVTDNDEVDNETVFVGVAGTQVQMYNVTDELYRVITTAGALGCSEGACTLWFNASDGAANLNESISISITVDDSVPAVFAPDVNETTVTSSTSITVEVNVTDVGAAGIDNESVFVGTGGTWVQMYNVSDELFRVITTPATLGCAANSVCTLDFNASDEVGNYNDTTDSPAINVDDSGPVVIPNPTGYPAGQSAAKDGDVVILNATVTDVPAGVSSVLVYATDLGCGVVTLYKDGATNYYNNTCTLISATEGVRNLTVNASDTLGSYNDTELITVTVDNTNPNVSSPGTNVTLLRSADSIHVQVYVTDATINYANVYVNGVSMTFDCGDLFFVDTTGTALGCTSDGACTLTFNASDNASNYNDSITTSITIDDTLPAVTDHYANDTVLQSSTDFLIEINVSDANLDNDSVYVNGNRMGNISANTFRIVTNPSRLGCSEGSCRLNFTVTDFAGNTNGSTYITITVDDTEPNISAVSSGTPASTSATITWTTDENSDSLVNYSTNSSDLSSSTSLGTLVTSHSMGLSSLTASTMYYYTITSCDDADNCNTSATYNFTTAAAGGGGGGGGGGGSTGTMYDDGVLGTGGAAEILWILGQSDRINFVYKDEGYYLRMSRVGYEWTDIEVSSLDDKLRLYKEDSTEIDLTGDGEMDIKITLQDILAGNAHLFVEALGMEPTAVPIRDALPFAPPRRDDAIGNETDTSIEEPVVPPEPEAVPEESEPLIEPDTGYDPRWIGGGILVVVILALLGFLGYRMWTRK